MTSQLAMHILSLKHIPYSYSQRGLVEIALASEPREPAFKSQSEQDFFSLKIHRAQFTEIKMADQGAKFKIKNGRLIHRAIQKI